MAETQTSDPSVILNAQGQPARRNVSDLCPNCRGGRDKRRNAAGGFGAIARHPICECGYEFFGERVSDAQDPEGR